MKKAEASNFKQQKRKSKKDNATKKKLNGSKSKKKDGKDTSKDTPKNAAQSSSLPSVPSLRIGPFHYLVAILSFIAGVYTPPLYYKYFVDTTTTNASSPNNAATVMLKAENVTLSSDETSTSSLVKKSKRPKNYLECNADNLSQFLHQEPIRGLHILCFPTADEDQDQKQGPQIMKVYKFAYSTGSDDVTSATNKDILQHDVPASFEELKYYLSADVNVEEYSRASMKQPWAIYSTFGDKLVVEYDRDSNIDGSKTFSGSSSSVMDKLQSHGMVLLFEGGSWLWPGVRIGFERTIQIYSKYDKKKGDKISQNVTLETLSLFPLVLSVKDFISEEECTHVQRKAEPSMRYSQVTLMDKDKGRPASDFRTSQSAFVGSDGDDIMTRLEHRTASLTRIHKSHQEHTQVLRYGEEEKYDAHLDWFDRRHYQKDEHTLRLIDNGRKNRLATVFWYLSDVEEGGHTNFPRFGKGPQPRDFTDCSRGLSVKPQRGKVIIFYSLTADGVGDELSLHGACKVKKGIKWAANKWVWNTPFHH